MPEKASLQDVAYLTWTPYGCAILRLLRIQGPVKPEVIGNTVHLFKDPPEDTAPDNSIRSPLEMDICNLMLEKFMELAPDSPDLRLTPLGESVVEVLELVKPEELKQE